MNKRPLVGLAVIIQKEGKVLLGKRKNSHGEGCWGFPGGHLEYGESFEECAQRETLEETGLEIKNLKSGITTNDIFEKEEKHYVTVFMICDYLSGNVEIREPEKCEIWEWFKWEDIPESVFLPITNLKKQGLNPFND